jgi:hypothetical protein
MKAVQCGLRQHTENRVHKTNGEIAPAEPEARNHEPLEVRQHLQYALEREVLRRRLRQVYPQITYVRRDVRGFLKEAVPALDGPGGN